MNMLVLLLATDWLNTKSAKVYNFFNPLCKMSNYSSRHLAQVIMTKLYTFSCISIDRKGQTPVQPINAPYVYQSNKLLNNVGLSHLVLTIQRT